MTKSTPGNLHPNDPDNVWPDDGSEDRAAEHWGDDRDGAGSRIGEAAVRAAESEPTDELPPLPEPEAHFQVGSYGVWKEVSPSDKPCTPLFNADQMHAYARAALTQASRAGSADKPYGWLRIAEEGPESLFPWFVRGGDRHPAYAAKYRPLYEHPAGSTESEPLREALEKIAQEWDGCLYDDAIGAPIDIGAALRESFRRATLEASKGSGIAAEALAIARESQRLADKLEASKGSEPK
jgi:hypothetical protein